MQLKWSIGGIETLPHSSYKQSCRALQQSPPPPLKLVQREREVVSLSLFGHTLQGKLKWCTSLTTKPLMASVEKRQDQTREETVVASGHTLTNLPEWESTSAKSGCTEY